MFLYDSVKKEKISLATKKEEVVNIYLCGPTVYDYAHLGHARSSICFDLLHRLLKAKGYMVNFARNYTDIDDKILNLAQKEQKSFDEISEFYISAYEEDMKALKILEPKYKPRATEHIKDIIEYILRLQGGGFTYTLDDGIYFDSSKDELYLSLSKRSFEDMQTRLDDINNKKNEADFVLWKFSPDFYDAPFGKGRPGWHSECVAMINALFKNELDIHAGGVDLLFPHHENEAAQCRCANKKELANYWLHNGFVNVDNEKMSKSLGNSFFVKDVLKDFQGEVLRFYLFGIHYRGHFNYSLEELINAKKRLDKFYRLKKRLGLAQFIQEDKKLITSLAKSMIKALEDDLNISKALALLDEFIIDSNSLLDKNPDDEDAKTRIKSSLLNAALLLGVGFYEPNEYFCFNIDEEELLYIEEQIAKRKKAKADKNYEEADLIREELLKKGIILMDKGEEVLWEKQ